MLDSSVTIFIIVLYGLPFWLTETKGEVPVVWGDGYLLYRELITLSIVYIFIFVFCFCQAESYREDHQENLQSRRHHRYFHKPSNC